MNIQKSWLKWICYIILIYSVILLQTTVLKSIRILGETPSLLPFIVCTISMLEGVNGGAAAGLAAGLLSDALFSPSEGFYTIVYVLCAIGISLLGNFIFWKNYYIALMYTVISMIIINLLYYLTFMLILGRGGMIAFFDVLPGELISTLILTPFVYPAIIRIYRRFYTANDSV
ncbi:MAG: rod shape-determining protein MreD [Clostridiales bacterium]|jgi:rod shape-determining protein MreD|nr:rod shape-determining protein MreD [Clostridiales bacterium]